MGYAGICGNSDVQGESDEYFHVHSLQQIAQHLNRTTCGMRESIANQRPSVSAPSGWIIPMGTPFVLTAKGNDADGDLLTYTFEEYYGNQNWNPHPSPPDMFEASRIRPTFRSYPPTVTPVRVFPKMDDLLFGTVSRHEQLPMSERSASANLPLNFRVTVRDGRGGFATSDVAVSVVARTTARRPVGPFTVVSPGAGELIEIGEPFEVEWNPARTNEAPVSCANVRISLATDERGVFAHELSASTQNDGEDTVAIPAGVPVGRAWIKVECVGNIFFNVSRPFTVLPHRTTVPERQD